MKLEVINRRKIGEFLNMGILNSLLLNNQEAKEEIRKEIRTLRWIKIKAQDTKTYGDAANTMLRGKFIAINTYINT